MKLEISLVNDKELLRNNLVAGSGIEPLTHSGFLRSRALTN